MERPGQILVADDDARNRRVLEAMLVTLGHAVSFANDGAEALEELRANPADLVLLDVMMPKMDGFEACKRIKASDETRTIPVVMVTSLSDVKDRVKALEAGADDFLTKPVDRTELTARVSSLLKVKAYQDHLKNHRKELEAEVGRKTAQVQQAFSRVKDSALETIFRLSRAAEYKDEDTAFHVQRMSRYAAAVGEKLGLRPEFVEAILNASPMHDVGKIGTPDRVLLKPGKLDAKEWKIMKQHTLIGASILKNAKAPVVRMGQIVALCHHEKWDGSGYPRGLKGEEIPTIARVAAIADVFDALVSKRPYKEPFPLEKALSIIRESRGSHFAPNVTDAFLDALGTILDIQKDVGAQEEAYNRATIADPTIEDGLAGRR